MTMTYEAFHALIGTPDDPDPCEPLWCGRVTWPKYSFEPMGDPYEEGWIYNHDTGVAFRGCIGDVIEKEDTGVEA